MNVPKLDGMLRPILALSVDAPITRVSATESMALHFGLSAEDRQVRIPSGKSTYVRNRTGWAMTFLTKGGLIEKVAPKQYRITERGRAFLVAHPKRKDGIEEVECSHGAYADEVEEGPLHAQIGERFMETLEHSICATFLLSFVGHVFSSSKWRATGSIGRLGIDAIRPKANSEHSRRGPLCRFRQRRRRAPSSRQVHHGRSRSPQSRLLQDLQLSRSFR